MATVGSPRLETTNPLVSVIIPTKNASKTLETCLRSIVGQTYPNFEIIIADGESQDGTGSIAERYGVRILKMPGFLERTAKKNLAAKQSKGDFLYFVDADFELTHTVIEKCLQTCQGGADGIIVPERVAWRPGFWSECRRFEILSYNGDYWVESPRFFRREVFFRAGGFDEALVFGEENDLCLKVRNSGGRIARISAYLYHHEGPIRSVIMRKFYYGKTSIAYLRKQKGTALAQFSPIRISWLANRRLLARDPLHAVGMLVQKFVQYLAAGIGLSIYLVESFLGYSRSKAR